MRQIFCKLPNPFPYLNYITKFFFGRKSYRQRVFQGPLTLGLQSPSLRRQLLPPCLRQPFHTRAQSYHRAKPRTCYFCILLSASVTTDVRSSRVLSQVFPARVPARSHLTAQTAHLLLLHPSVLVGYNRPLLPAYTSGENPLYFSYEKNLYRKP